MSDLKIPAEVTIVMPVRNQTTYFRQALNSALNQTVPVSLIVHDSSPLDVGFRELIGKDSDRVEYHHFTDQAGIAGDWNRAMGLAKTRWISFLHQDDILLPNGIELLLEARQKMPGRPLYFGLDDGIDETGIIRYSKTPLANGDLVEIPPEEFAVVNQFCAPGALIDRDLAFKLGGFTHGLQMTLDWDLWFRLNLHSGTVRVNAIVAQFRDHFDPKRGTTVQELSGDKLVKLHLQLKRNLARLKACSSAYVPPPYPEGYLCEMARGDLCVKGNRLTKMARRICFLFILRRQKHRFKAHPVFAYLSALYLTNLWTAYSYIRPYRRAIK